ncbi:choice-of-anchor Q domain-containing protein [Arenicella xantha]|uniref:Putative outer membrane repeat protein n=1 Tax=Arenicella xantha TaxID=644221 RepID=A0A395JNF5_9GAMM|nr:choice-of-anchor Q domain-containing protein [Arenicella xantha]RBP51128.1 putative outer membrane repeat protein [Arenicella xantha]
MLNRTCLKGFNSSTSITSAGFEFTKLTSTRAAFTKVALAVSLATSGPLSAATISVSGACTLKNAIISANQNSPIGGCSAGSGADTIFLPSGTLTYSNAEPGVDISGGSALPVVDSQITIQGSNSSLARSASLTTPDFRLLTVGSAGNLTINDVEIVNGMAPSGGGILCTQATLTVSNSNLQRNSSSIQGGAIASDNCSLTVNGLSSFSNNVSNTGGAIFALTSSVSLSNSDISANQAETGGGVAVEYCVTTISDVQINDNSASNAGALALIDSVSSYISDSEFTGNQADESGGAVGVSFGVVTIKQTTMSGNEAGFDGGAISTQDADLTLSNSQLSENSVMTGGGGGIYSLSNITHIDSSSVTFNSASTGGGVDGRNSTLTLSNSTLNSNDASSGGAIYSGYSELSLSDNNVANNHALVAGGAVYVANNGHATRLSNNLINLNSTDGYGGGMVVAASSDVVMTRDRIMSNAADQAGGLLIVSNSSVTLRDASVQSNSAINSSGGVSIDGSELTIERSTISENSSNVAAGISATNGSAMKLLNSTVSLNTAGFSIGGIQLSNSNASLVHATVFQNSGGSDASGIYWGGASSSVSLLNSIIALNGVSDCNVPADTGLQGNWFSDSSCSGDADGDPLLAPLANNGGPTETHALVATSGAIDLALTSFCKVPIGKVDQRGYQRDGACDSGAYEFGASDITYYVIPLPSGDTVVIPL